MPRVSRLNAQVEINPLWQCRIQSSLGAVPKGIILVCCFMVLYKSIEKKSDFNK